MVASTASFRRVGSLLLLVALVLILASCSSTSAPSQSYDPVVSWIQQNAVSLRTVNPGGSDADLAALSQMVGSASLVGLGEATHGTHEFIEVKARIAEYLISHLGFTTFVMENDWGAARACSTPTSMADQATLPRS